jgi:hypothetical protein
VLPGLILFFCVLVPGGEGKKLFCVSFYSSTQIPGKMNYENSAETIVSCDGVCL